jgi:hypothetical protein
MSHPDTNNPNPLRPVDVENINLERMREQASENAALLPYASTRGSALVKPEDQGKIKGNAIMAMEQQTDIQMQQIVQQMKTLTEQAKAIQNRKIISERIYLAEMRFEPIIGKVYYLYEKNGANIMSLVAPEEWGRSGRHLQYIAKVHLLADHTWDVLHLSPEFDNFTA